jgi:hypothetical protein
MRWRDINIFTHVHIVPLPGARQGVCWKGLRSADNPKLTFKEEYKNKY